MVHSRLHGQLSRERVLIFLWTRGEGYAREIARFFNTNLDPILLSGGGARPAHHEPQTAAQPWKTAVIPIRQMSDAELAAYVSTHLRNKGIEVVLSGGACVSIHSNRRYVSMDLDLINIRFAGLLRQ